MEATLTLHQAGNQLGVGESVLSRLIRIGALPEARKVHRPEGSAWVIPVDDLQTVATRNGWTIDLRDDPGGTSPRPNTDMGTTTDTRTSNNRTGDPWISANPKTGDTQTGDPRNSAGTTSRNTKTSDPWISAGTTSGDSLTSDPWISAGTTSSDNLTIEVEPTTGGTAPAPGAGNTPIDEMAENTVGAALVPHDDPADSDGSAIEVSQSPEGAPSMVEAMDLALLDRLLGVQEDRVTAQVEARETKHALTALNAAHNRTTGELEIERRERMVTADRYREERMARAVADAKIAELRDRVVREMSLADAEKQARSEALARSIRAERDAANAMASMGWLARRRYKRLSRSTD